MKLSGQFKLMIAGAASTALAASALAFAAPGAAQAASHGTAVRPHITAARVAAVCPSGATCSYTGTNYTGQAGPVYGNNTNDYQYYTWSHAESVANNGTQCTDWLYQNENYGGYDFYLYIGYEAGTLSGTVYWHHLESNHWCNPG